MNARDELALLLINTQRSRYSLPPRETTEHCSETCWAEADAILAAGYSKPRTITTAEELDALPVDSVVGDWTGRVYQKDAEEEAPEFPWWMTTGDQRRYPAKRITLPATVLYEPQP